MKEKLWFYGAFGYCVYTSRASEHNSEFIVYTNIFTAKLYRSEFRWRKVKLLWDDLTCPLMPINCNRQKIASAGVINFGFDAPIRAYVYVTSSNEASAWRIKATTSAQV